MSGNGWPSSAMTSLPIANPEKSALAGRRLARDDHLGPFMTRQRVGLKRRSGLCLSV
jgi:hypothetical protein